MDSLSLLDDVMKQAFRLAYFIHAEKTIAQRIADAALLKLEVASAAQSKRLYYMPAKRNGAAASRNDSSRTKVFFSDRHLLQRLVYIESEPYERAKETANGASAPDEEAMIIHFTKHLVRITLKRNSFYVSLGMARLLHNYSTAETMEIYNVVVQDPERVKDDYYYRARKGHLMKELRERFGELISVVRGQHGEERFEPHGSPESFTELIARCLSHFTPWSTACVIPDKFDPTSDELERLCAARSGTADAVEINRIHSVLHPDCFVRLTNALKLEFPSQKLNIPLFQLSTNGERPPPQNDRRRPPPLSDEDMAAIRLALAEQSGRRRKSYAPLLLVNVDGTERARIDLERATCTAIDIDSAAELVEVYAREKGEEILLATHLLETDDRAEGIAESRSAITLEGGQHLSFRVRPCRRSNAEGATVFLEVRYRETNPGRALLLFLRRARFHAMELAGTAGSGRVRWLKPGLVSLLFALVAVAGLMLYSEVRRGREARTFQAATGRPATGAIAGTAPSPDENNTREPPTVSTQPNLPRVAGPAFEVERPAGAERRGRAIRQVRAQMPLVAPTRLTAAARTQRPDEPTPPQPGNPAGASRPGTSSSSGAAAEDSETTRSLAAGQAAPLTGVRKVFIEMSGDRDLAGTIADLVRKKLGAGGRLEVVLDKDEADAALKLTVNGLAANASAETDRQPAEDRISAAGSRQKDSAAFSQLSVVVRLVNENGDVIWPTRKANRYSGEPADIASRLVKDLLDQIRDAEAPK